ncbi:probable E3 ubiquitin-protein ligase plr-1 [Impatiens glandulifera]|uniref:probable E3 ubiquitin-protein ligase plr-1 n=1 Tax=Impatiens glandulifera TaxID=253017 RepID=UPI001FB0D431|nr:probable E3 ubiquitin-protein ligase plr-1 [Impatiens glandulifera]
MELFECSFQHVYVTIKFDDTFKINELPTYSISLHMITVKEEWNRSTGSESMIIDEKDIGPEVWTYLENIQRHEIATYVQKWLRESDVQLNERKKVSEKINNILRECSIMCYFSFYIRLEYDIDKIMDENKSMASDREEKYMCTICLENYNVGDEINLMLHCSQQFHCDCIKNWMKISNSCPLCREPILSYMY